MFKFKKIRAFAVEQSTLLAKKIPAHTLTNHTKQLSIGKTTQALEQLYQQALRFKEEYKLGFIGISLLSNYLKWELRSKNYPENFIEIAIEGLIVNIFKK